jgi:hypothetical protein
LPLVLAPACLAAPRRAGRLLVLALLVGLTAWNLHAVCQLTRDFSNFTITAGW